MVRQKQEQREPNAVQHDPVAITITPPNFKTISVELEGTAPLMQARFGEKAKQAMMGKMLAGSTAKKGTKREPRNFDSDFEEAIHRSTDGWIGVPAAAIRNACIDACRMTGFAMTRAKMSIRVIQDGIDAKDSIPLIRLDAEEPERREMVVRNATGVVDIRVRPVWPTWRLHVRIEFDADQFTPEDVVNLLSRAGGQVGIGEGRPFSKQSNGLGFGTFAVVPATK